MGSNYMITPDGNFISENELYHWGIKGMKWGVRRYQNSDGSLTAAGRKRYTNADGTLNKKGEKYYAKESARLDTERKKLNNQKRTAAQLAKLDNKRKANEKLKDQINPKKTEEAKKKSIKDMSDNELNAAINRARLEDTYKQLRPEPKSKEAKRAEIMNKLVNDVVVPSAINAGKNALNKMIDKAMKDKVDPNSYEALKKTYDKLKIQKDIEKLKRGEDPDSKPLTWDEKIKKQQYEANERRYAKEAAEEAAAKRTRQEGEKTKGTSKDASKESVKKVDDLLTELDLWDNVMKIEQYDNASAKRTSKQTTKPNNKDTEKRVDDLLAEMDERGWEIYRREYGGR